MSELAEQDLRPNEVGTTVTTLRQLSWACLEMLCSSRNLWISYMREWISEKSWSWYWIGHSASEGLGASP